MNVQLNSDWKELLSSEFEKDYFKELVGFVKQAYNNSICYPPGKLIFNAFERCKLKELKVVIIGQDPYHGPGQANGLCFSVNPGVAHPPSLINIFKEIEQDLNIPYPKSGDLSNWADQGVLLLNATLTVEQHQAGSHQKKGWETFTDAAISKISDTQDQVVFLLWGGFAKKKKKLIDIKKHFILETGHPSPLSANRGYWFGNKHFSKTNDILVKNGKKPLNWSVTH